MTTPSIFYHYKENLIMVPHILCGFSNLYKKQTIRHWYNPNTTKLQNTIYLTFINLQILLQLHVIIFPLAPILLPTSSSFHISSPSKSSNLSILSSICFHIHNLMNPSIPRWIYSSIHRWIHWDMSHHQCNHHSISYLHSTHRPTRISIHPSTYLSLQQVPNITFSW